jgi:molybdopterin synthase catalytic subunit
MTVRVQSEDFDLGREARMLAEGKVDIGAVVTFVGLVRDTANSQLLSMELEHYPAMTEQALKKIDSEAQRRWSLDNSLIIHRYGNLRPGEQIMMVATASKHRKDAFEAAEYLMDYLKTDAPFWKKEHFKDHAKWVSSKSEDEAAKDRWSS